MSPITIQILYTFETALVLAFSTIGVYLAIRVMRFPDLTAEGSFGLAAMAGGIVLISTQSAFLAVLTAVAIGACCGICTAFLANIVRLPTILASILTMTMCVSIALVVAGKPSESLPDIWIFDEVIPGVTQPLAIGIGGSLIVLIVLIAGLSFFLRTGAGLVLRARGENPLLAREFGHSLFLWDCIGLSIANGLVGLSAALLSQRSGYASSNMGRGIAISAFAAIMLGEAVFPASRFWLGLLGCIAATVVLQSVRLVALNLGIPDGGLDLATSLLVIGFYCAAKFRSTSQRNLLERIRM